MKEDIKKILFENSEFGSVKSLSFDTVAEQIEALFQKKVEEFKKEFKRLESIAFPENEKLS